MRICFLICFICLFLCVLTGFISLLVQLVVSSDFNRLQRKYEGFVYCVLIWCLFCAFLWLNVKNLKLFCVFV